MPRARWNFHRGLCGYPGSACKRGEILSERKAIALGAIQNPLDVIYITAKTGC